MLPINLNDNNNERQKIIKAKKFNTLSKFNDYINSITNTKSVVSRHYFSDSQWIFPTKEIYIKLQKTGFFNKEYESLRRVFNPQKNIYEVIDIPIINQNENTKHPTTKPLALIKTFIKASSNKNSIILDAFMGSGTTALACLETNRQFIGFEIDEDYYKICEDRIQKFNDTITIC